MAGLGQTSGLGPRERRWLLAFLVLGSAYFAVLLAELVLGFLGGFSQILLILFLAWLLAFVMSPVARFLDRKSTRLNSSHLKLSRMPSSA